MIEGHVDLAILGASGWRKMVISQVDDTGQARKGMGGAMDLVAGVKRVVVIMDQNAEDGSQNFSKNVICPSPAPRW